MPGTGSVTIGNRQWTVEVASTQTELMTGLAGRTSLDAGAGMLFILPSAQQVTVTTQDMLFPIDIIFIASNTVLDVASNIQPGYDVTEETPCDSFLEVNAGEAAGVSQGDTVSVEYLSTVVDNISQIISFTVPLAAIGFVSSMAGGMASLIGGSSHSSSEIRRLGRPRTEEERAKVHKEFYGAEELPPRGTGLKEREEPIEGRRLGEPKVEAERKKTHERKYATAELPERGIGLALTEEEQIKYELDQMLKSEWIEHYDYVVETLGRKGYSKETVKEVLDEEIRRLGEKLTGEKVPAEHHSMWFSTKQREECEKEAGAIACRWAEEFVAPGDFESAKKAARVFYEKMREAIGIA